MDGTVLPVAALAVNTGPVRRAVGAWKDGGRADVTPWFAAVAARAAPGVVAAGAVGVGVGAVAGATAGRVPLLVVPAPPSPLGLARRGEDLVARVARGLADGLAPSTLLTLNAATG
jgi:predicted amidophosphoribosyltransferase